MLFPFIVFLTLTLRANVSASCSTYATSCALTIGSYYKIGSSPDISLPTQSSFYGKFNVPAGDNEVNLLVSNIYGIVEIFAAVSRQASETDYDYSLVGHGDNFQNSRGEPVSVMIRAISDSLFRTVLYSSSSKVSMTLGFPFQTNLERGGRTKFSFIAQDVSTLDIVLTPLTGTGLPMFQVNSPTRYWTSNGNTTDLGIISITPSHDEVSKTFTVITWLSDEGNVSTAIPYTVLATETRDVHPITLIGGMPQKEKVAANTEKFFVLRVPPDLTETVTISVTSSYGDADLYVNPSDMGFYHRSKILTSQPDPAPVWSSGRPGSSADEVSISPTDLHYQTSGVYYVSVFGFQASVFTITGGSESSIVTLIEGEPLQGSVNAGSYKYYRFVDTRPTLDVMIDLQSTSGDADLYVSCVVVPTGTDSGWPSKSHFNYSSALYGEDAMWIRTTDSSSCAKHGGVFYLAVRGYSTARYSLTAMHYGGTRTLAAGLPVTATVYKNLGAWYQFKLGKEVMQVTITLTSVTGDADMFVSVGETAHTYSYDYRSSSTGTLADVIVIPEAKLLEDSWISVLVYGYTTARYSIVVTLEDTVVVLTDCQPQQGSVKEGLVQYYSIQAPANASAYAVLTVFSGSPQLYMSMTTVQPHTEANGTLKSDSESTGNLPTVHISSVPATAQLYIGVAGGSTNSTYTVRVSFDQRWWGHWAGGPPPLLKLIAGVPQSDTITVWQHQDHYHSSSNSSYHHHDSAHGSSSTISEWKFYQIPVQPGHEVLKLQSARTVGEVDVYVSRCPKTTARECAPYLPNSTHFLQNTVGMDDDLLSISREDKTPCSYLVGVHSLSRFAAYQMTYSLDHTLIALRAGVSVTDHVTVGELDYYTFLLDSDFSSLKISLTTVSGDPDLFVSTTIKRPGVGNYTWLSYRYGSDTLIIDPSKDSSACTHCTYYIAVYGAYESTYSITVTTASTLPQLVDGRPLSDFVTMFGWNQYSFFDSYGSSRDIKIQLTSLTGDADLYVTLDGTTPGWLNHAYASWNLRGSDEIVMSHTDGSKFDPCLIDPATDKLGCQIRVAVNGVLQSNYSIVLTTSLSATTLLAGTPHRGVVAQGKIDEYRVVASAATSTSDYTLTVSLTVTSGRLIAYVSCGTNALPNRTFHSWTLDPREQATLEIPSFAAVDHGCKSNNNDAGTPFYVAVYGNTSAVYSVVATSSDSSTMTALIPGSPQSGRIGYKEFQYFVVRPGSFYQDIRIIATVTQGDVDVYISATWDTRPQYSTPLHTVMSFLLSSSGVGGESLLIKHDTALDLCSGRPSCYLVVGVYGVYGTDNPSVKSSYSLVSAFVDSTVQLTNGVPLRGVVAKGREQLYKYSLVLPDRDVVFSLTALSGDADLFIGLPPKYHPTRTNYTWMSMAFGQDTLQLQASAIATQCVPNPTTGKHCDFYIAVYGFLNSSYSLLVATDDGFADPVTLLDRQPQTGSVQKGMYKYYQFDVSGGNWASSNPLPTSITISLTPSSSTDVDLYVQFEGGGEPGKDNYAYKSNSWGSVVDQVKVSSGMEHFCLSCTVYVAVYGYSTGGYTITATSQGLPMLQSGHATGDHIDTSAYSYYTFYNPDRFGVVSVILTMVYGDADLYISTYSTAPGVTLFGGRNSLPMPTRESSTWHSLHFGDDSIAIDYLDPDFCYDCVYIVGVYGYRNSSFTLLVTEKQDTVIKMANNRPQTMNVTVNGLKYFSAQTTSSADDMTFTLTPLDTGFADIYVQAFNVSFYTAAMAAGTLHLPQPGQPSTYLYSTQGSESNFVRIPGPHEVSTVFVVCVKALSQIRFSIVAKTSQIPILIQAGVPQSHFVTAGHMEYFRFYPSAEEDLRISVTARSGDPDLYVTTSEPLPVCVQQANGYSIICSNYTWSSRMYSTDQIALSKDFPCSAVIASTYISPTCDPLTAYEPGKGLPITIGVYGYKDSQFTILAVPTGRAVTLLAGQPQLSLTEPGFVCSNRSEASGACLPSTKVKQAVLLSSFSFQVSPPTAASSMDGAVPKALGDVLITIVPRCATNVSVASIGHDGKSVMQHRLQGTVVRTAHDLITVSALSALSQQVAVLSLFPHAASISQRQHAATGPHHDHGLQHHLPWSPSVPASDWSPSMHTTSSATSCTPGCACNPLRAYVSSCPLSKCSVDKKHPSQLHHDASVLVDSSVGSTLVLPQSKENCDPLTAGEACGYFISVIADSPVSAASPLYAQAQPTQQASFSIVAKTPYDISLVPCDTSTAPDGIRFASLDIIRSKATPSRNYELCASGGETLVLSLEQCAGATSLYVCADDGHCPAVLPTSTSWAYSANAASSCSRTWVKYPGTSNTYGWGSQRCGASGGPGPSISLPQRADGNYFVTANGTGEYVVRVGSTILGGKVGAPSLVLTDFGAFGNTPKVDVLTGNALSVRWPQARVIMPGLSEPVEASLVTYVAVIVDVGNYSTIAATVEKAGGTMPLLNSPCGLALAASRYPHTVMTVRVTPTPYEEDRSDIARTFASLFPNRLVSVTIIATCDSNCLRQLSKVLPKSGYITCNGKHDCQPQSLLYVPLQVTTGAAPDAETGTGTDTQPSGPSEAWVRNLLYFAGGLVVCVLMAMAALSFHWAKLRRTEREVDVGFQMSDLNESTRGDSEYKDIKRFVSQRRKGGGAMADDELDSSSSGGDGAGSAESGAYVPPSAASRVSYFGQQVSAAVGKAMRGGGGSGGAAGATGAVKPKGPYSRLSGQGNEIDEDEEIEVSL